MCFGPFGIRVTNERSIFKELIGSRER